MWMVQRVEILLLGHTGLESGRPKQIFGISTIASLAMTGCRIDWGKYNGVIRRGYRMSCNLRFVLGFLLAEPVPLVLAC